MEYFAYLGVKCSEDMVKALHSYASCATLILAVLVALALYYWAKVLKIYCKAKPAIKKQRGFKVGNTRSLVLSTALMILSSVLLLTMVATTKTVGAIKLKYMELSTVFNGQYKVVGDDSGLWAGSEGKEVESTDELFDIETLEGAIWRFSGYSEYNDQVEETRAAPIQGDNSKLIVNPDGSVSQFPGDVGIEWKDSTGTVYSLAPYSATKQYYAKFEKILGGEEGCPDTLLFQYNGTDLEQLKQPILKTLWFVVTEEPANTIQAST